MAAKAAEAVADSVTNVQHAGVDEGGIVKLHGEHLVVLRRGRLFTVRIAGGALEPVSSADAFGPDVDPHGAWYDEMLIAGNTIAVIGYSYARGGTEVGLFDISRAGRLAHKGTYHLRSNDYYSSRNYASRLIGTKLVFYSPLYLNPFVARPVRPVPGDAQVALWRDTGGVQAHRAGDAHLPHRRAARPVLRAWRCTRVSVCDLAKPELECESTAVMGPPGRVFYVSPNSVFVWATQWRRGGRAAPARACSAFRSTVRRRARSRPPAARSTSSRSSRATTACSTCWCARTGAARACGRPRRIRATSRCCACRSRASPTAATARRRARTARCRSRPATRSRAVTSARISSTARGPAGTGRSRRAQSQLYAVRYAGGAETYEVPLVHAVDRIEALGANAVAVGSDGRDLHFTSLRLARFPVAVDRYTRKDAAQGETRSHGFFYKPEAAEDGMLGLPIIGGGEPAGRQLRKESAALLYLRNRGLSFSELGLLEARPTAAERNDGCRASCVDWYGNSRPLFVGGRVFALMGYEIVEGAATEKRIVETRRISFVPRPVEISR